MVLKLGGLTRRQFTNLCLGTLVMASLPLAGVQALDSVAREDTLVTESPPAGTTFTNYNTLNPFVVGGDPRSHLQFVLEPLFYWSNLSAEHIPFLATGYEFNDDYTSVTVTLREGVTWADGEAFDADDVVFTFEMLRENGEGAKDLVNAQEVATALEKATKVDAHTVRFDLKHPDPRFVLGTLTVTFNKGVFPVPQHVYNSVEDIAGFQDNDIAAGHPIGTGPYQVVAAVPERIILDRRDDWWGATEGVWGDQEGANYTDLPQPKRIITIPRNDYQQGAQAMLSQQLDWMAEAPVPIMEPLLSQAPFITTYSDREPPYGNIDWWPTSLFFNHDSEAVSDPEIRRAISYAINAEQVIEVFHQGYAELISSPMPDFEALGVYNEALEPVAKEHELNAFDPEKSAEIMTGIGYEKDGEGFWSKDGERWTARIFAAQPLETQGPIIAEQLRRAGFDATFTRTPDYRQIIFSGNFDMALWGHGGAIYDPYETMFLYHSDFYRPVGEIATRFWRWKNERFDELTEKVAQLPIGDPKIEPLVKEAFTIWMDEVVEVPISEWYHRIPFSTVYWSNWPSVEDPYAPPTISHWTALLVIHGLEKTEG